MVVITHDESTVFTLLRSETRQNLVHRNVNVTRPLLALLIESHRYAKDGELQRLGLTYELKITGLHEVEFKVSRVSNTMGDQLCTWRRLISVT